MDDPDQKTRHNKPIGSPKPTWLRLAIGIGTLAVYALAFVPLYRIASAGVVALALLPVVAAGWLLGGRAGLLGGLLATLLNTLLLNLVGEKGWDVLIHNGGLAGSVAIVVIGIAAGWLGQFVAQIKRQSLELTNERELLKAQIAEREQIEEELRLQRDFAMQVMNTMGQGLTVTDADGCFEFVNPAYAQMLGYTPEALIGKAIFDVTLAEDLGTLAQSRARRLNGETNTYELRLRQLDGNPMHALITGVPRWRGNQVAGTIAVISNITERKRTEAALRRRDATLEAVSFAAERFLETSGWKRNIQTVLERLGTAADVSRVYMFENHTDADGALLTSQRYEWVAPGVAPQLENQELQDFSFRATGFMRWEAALSRGDLISGHVRAFPDDEQAVLATHDIYSLVVVPIFAGQTWWGHIGFDQCQIEREWTSAEADALKAAAGIIGAAIQDDRSKEALLDNAQRYRELFATAQRQARELALLDQVRTALARELDLPSILRIVVEAITTTFGYPLVSLYLLQDEVLYLQHQVGYNRLIDRFPITKGVIGRTARTGEPVLLEDVRSDPNFLGEIDDVSSEVAVPLFDQEKVVGVLNVESSQGVRLSAADLQIMIALSQHVNIAIGRARSYAEARESEERYRRLVELSPEPIGVHSQGKVVYINAAGGKLFGANDPAELFGKPVRDLVHPDYWEIASARMRQTQEHMQKVELIEEKFVRLDGKVIDVEVTGIPITYMGELATQIVIRDITERKRMEQDRLTLERKLLETQKLESLGVLAGGIAHDFNNLLMGVLGNASLALLELPANSPADYSIRQIEIAAGRAADLTRQMLAYSGRGHFVVQPLDLNTLVEEMSHLLQIAISKSIMLQYHLGERLPPIEADAMQIRQVVMNLIVNAAEAIGDDVGTITLTTGIRHADHAELAAIYLAHDLPAGDYLYLEVDDTGSGMDADTLAKIFEPFFTTKFTGRGLGLAAVLGIVRGHHGALKVQSQPARGTTFTILLPTPTDQRMTTDDVNSSVASGRRSAGAGGTVLVVDDEQIF
jgi:PAS domain S-box-containing protein